MGRDKCGQREKELDASKISNMPNAEATKDLTGVSEEKFKKSRIKVSNVNGYLCHISSESTLHCPPSVAYAILTNPDNTGVFRDIKALGYRKVLRDEPEGYKVIEVEQRGEVKILWHTHFFSTFLTVTEDDRDPSALKTTFTLIKSDVLSKFQGTWNLYPQQLEDGTLTTRAFLEQDVLPVGVPAFLTNMPILGNVLRGICVRTVRRLLEDIDAVVQKTQQGVPLEQVLSSGRKRPQVPEKIARVGSHAVELSDSEDEEQETATDKTKSASDVLPDQLAPLHPH